MSKTLGVADSKKGDPAVTKTGGIIRVPILSGQAARRAFGIRDPRPKAVALHEAGHLMAALVLGIPLEKIAASIPGRGGRFRQVNLWPHAREGEVADRRYWENLAIMYLAGQAAREIESGRTMEDLMFTMADGDRDFVRTIVEKCLIPPNLPDWESEQEVAKDYYNVILARSRSLVATHWKAVKALAAALYSQKKLTLAQARKIVRTTQAA
jgi:hypothetical protein